MTLPEPYYTCAPSGQPLGECVTTLAGWRPRKPDIRWSRRSAGYEYVGTARLVQRVCWPCRTHPGKVPAA